MGAIVVFSDDNRDGLGDAPRVFLDDVATVHGLLFDTDALLYTLDRGVFSLPFVAGDRVARAPRATHTRLADLSDSVRWTHTLARATDGALYVTMGQHDDARCPPFNRRAGSVLRIGAAMPIEGARVIDGLLNPMFMRCKAWVLVMQTNSPATRGMPTVVSRSWCNCVRVTPMVTRVASIAT
jgi:hypothetical protein